MITEAFFQKVQKSTLPGVWSKAIALARENAVQVDTSGQDEIILRVRVPNRPVSAKVELWPDDEDWHCDCGDRNDPCAHIGASVITLKNQKAHTDTGRNTAAIPSGVTVQAARFQAPVLHYRLIRIPENQLSLERWLVSGEKETRLTDSLVSYMGGINSGRIASPLPAATKEDFGVDAVLGSYRHGALESRLMPALLQALESFPHLFLDAVPIRASGRADRIELILRDEPGGFRLKSAQGTEMGELFGNSSIRVNDLLKLVSSNTLTQSEKALISGEGHFFPLEQGAQLVSEILPALQKKIHVEIKTSRLPQLVQIAPRISLYLEKSQTGAENTQTLMVLPSVVYGNPPIARLDSQGKGVLELLDAHRVPARDPAAEKMIVQKLRAELHLQPGQWTRFEGQTAVEFTAKLKNWDAVGEGLEQFRLDSDLVPRFEMSENDFEIFFETGDRASAANSPYPTDSPSRSGTVPWSDLQQAWREDRSYVPLLGGGWAPLPRDWLEKYGERIEQLIAAKKTGGAQKSLPSYLMPDLIRLCDELGQPYSTSLQTLKSQLETFEGIPEAPLPKDLHAELRSYQKRGIDWLSFLRDSEMGAMLADDMGLGKTLQAMCAIRGKTLIITPTSVLQSWVSQIQQFRPGLSVSLYYGPARALDPGVDITLTTYGLLRQDREKLTQKVWGTIILDEAQIIKNPESQITQAAHELKGNFRITLSGTPVENRLDDLWSQFHFLNPGLLGSRQKFQDQWASPIARGDTGAAQRLRQKIKPFILRRLKREVAPELPPRTEKVLHCELTESERELYQAILTSTRAEVVRALETGGSIFSALEVLLRLRQACCHPSLIPSQNAEGSSKVALLVQTLENSQAMGHRALVFSQWTSYLDLIEPHLERSGIGFLRLDGSTTDRKSVVERFQHESGPPVLLMSLKAGGVGLTLTAADHVFIMDPWWNPAAEDQAADRAHRIGQENPVLIHRLVAKDTIEDRILELQKRKLLLAQSVLSEAGAAVSITRDDLLALFG